jgi:hypothetical protein
MSGCVTELNRPMLKQLLKVVCFPRGGALFFLLFRTCSLKGLHGPAKVVSMIVVICRKHISISHLTFIQVTHLYMQWNKTNIYKNPLFDLFVCSKNICTLLRWTKNINIMQQFQRFYWVTVRIRESVNLNKSIDYGLWNVVPLTFNGCVKLLDIGGNWNLYSSIQSIPNMLNGWHVWWVWKPGHFQLSGIVYSYLRHGGVHYHAETWSYGGGWMARQWASGSRRGIAVHSNFRW